MKEIIPGRYRHYKGNEYTGSGWLMSSARLVQPPNLPSLP